MILSLTRTKRVGYLRDVRRLTVALSRARLGLYILGRREVFETCYELKEAFDRLLTRPDQLMLVPGEMHPTSRGLNDEVKGAEMTGVEHLGQYVYEMTQAKVKQLGTFLEGNESFPSHTKMDMTLDDEGDVERDEEDEEEEVDQEEDRVGQPEELDV